MIRNPPLPLATAGLLAAEGTVLAQPNSASSTAPNTTQTHYRAVTIGGVKISYRETGPLNAPTVLLLHGLPTSSHVFRDMIPRLADAYHVVAPNYPGFRYSDAPGRTQFSYTFDNYARPMSRFTEQIGLGSYARYVMDSGAPVGFRPATGALDKVMAIIVQSGKAYDEGTTSLWDPARAFWRTGTGRGREATRAQSSPESTQWQYTDGVKDPSLLSPIRGPSTRCCSSARAMRRSNSIWRMNIAPTRRSTRNGRVTSAGGSSQCR